MVMGVVYWTLMIGFLIGALAKLFFQRMRRGQMNFTMFLSLIGSIVAGGLGERIGLYKFGSQNSLIASLIGAVFSVSVYCIYFMRTSKGSRSLKLARR